MEGSSTPYVDTPYGLLTEGGRWYHVTESDVEEYAGAVLNHVPLAQLLRWADTWVDSARTVTVWALPLMLWGLPVGWAVGGALTLFVAWALLSPSLPSLLAVRAVSALDHVLAQALYYVVAMSAVAAAEMYAALGAGLLGFVLLRWGVLEWAAGYVVRPLRRALYPLPVADQVLRGLIVRVALKHRLSLPQVDDITKDILDNLHDRQGTDPDDA
ncbi:hypothetical protein GGP80_002224 [Salinibacter ruber]|jgi:hypothetical protein|uniref:Uncharacterized protein n=2 Tax=Salinibacter ruber TaxID=146919 RepID=A0A840EEQ7_9BACT|nr:hypothetical protein [Salinibacter ruber]MBB4060577.1 hypothetical protein [Salinibacter ruber]MBB4068615.1 hypothetical protein [Salinibacter ruber]MBB4089022.1 hypothetical protein [Salinibacter ruber]MCS3629512.1 hypothetical protein [Salinibacter ruber]MCS3638996.1 hypothetical protein [Salinibacter ruber]